MNRTPLNVLVGVIAAGSMIMGQCLPVLAQTYNGQPLQGRVTYVPTGTTLDASLASPIDSALAKPGDLFQARMYGPLMLGSDLVLPASTMLEGMVAGASKGGLAGSNGAMTLRLTSAITPDGVRYPLSAIVSAEQDKGIHSDKDGNLKGRTTSSSVKSGVVRTALWTGGGTLLGICFAPIVGGAVGAGAIVGVATGGAVGLGSNLWRKGKDVKIPSGTRLQFILDQPMSLTSMAGGSPSANMSSNPTYTNMAGNSGGQLK